MFKLKVEERALVRKPMREMKPCEICRITCDSGVYAGDIALRTASIDSFEVMNLSNPGVDECWGKNTNLMVEEMPSGTEITLVVE